MKILFLTLSRLETIDFRGIYADLMRELLRRGHELVIVSPAERRFKQSTHVGESLGAKILRVKTLNIQKTNVMEKGIGTLLLESQYMKAIKKYFPNEKFDLVLYSTPPITFNKVIEWQKSRGAQSYLLLKDIFPQNAVDLGMMKRGSLIWKLFRKKEEKLYGISDGIGCMSPANCRFVIDNNPSIDKSKVEVCPNSIELVNNDGNRDKSVLLKYGIPTDKPLFIYGGNLGKPQGIDFLIKVLGKVKGREDLHFLVVGAGTEAHKLKEWYETNKGGAVTVMDFIPKEDYDNVARAADVGIVLLDRRFSIPNFPSRLLVYLENKMPVILATDVNTDMGSIAEDNGFGFWSEHGELNTFIKNMDKLAKNPELRIKMGERGYKYLLDNYTVDKTADVIERFMKR